MATGDAIGTNDVEERINNLDPEKAATFIYTSGTTGPPKAVMLSHDNLAWTADLAVRIVNHSHTDKSLSYLPLSHIAEQMFTLHAPITSGASVYFAESVEKMPDNLKEVQPTVFFGVPRVWEKFHAGIAAKLELATGAKAKLVAFARRTGTAVAERKNQGLPINGLLAVKYKLARKLIFVEAAIGMRGPNRVSGAAPIAPDVGLYGKLDVTIWSLPIGRIRPRPSTCLVKRASVRWEPTRWCGSQNRRRRRDFGCGRNIFRATTRMKTPPKKPSIATDGCIRVT